MMLSQVELCKLQSKDIWKQLSFIITKSRFVRDESFVNEVYANANVFGTTCCACTQGPPGPRGPPGEAGENG
ncbi:unnamed protein product [Toxocara canis]|nr:unnamed protein product [Toxocara canis]